MKKLGIIGGMGPAATADLFTRIVNMTDVQTDQEHIDIVILNDPSVPDRTAYILGKPGSESFVPILRKMASELEGMDCEILVMPCNAAHSRHDDISSVLKSSHLLNILDETADFAVSLGSRTAGIMATDGIVESGAYTESFEKIGASTVLPDPSDQKMVMSAIYDYVKAGVKAPTGLLNDVMDDLIEQGADCLILGCTELSLLNIPYVYKGVPVIDTLDTLAYAAVKACEAPVKDLTKLYR